MSDSKEYYTEKVERYCHIIGKNTTFSRVFHGKERRLMCDGCEECEKNGGCKHHLFSKSYTSKKEG